MKKHKIVVDSGALLECFKLILDSYHKKLNQKNHNRLIQFIELFKARELIIVPQVLAELYSLLKREAKKSNTQMKHWLEILENPYLKGLLENYVQKELILEEKKYLEFGFIDIALMKTLNQTNLLLTVDFRLIQLCRHNGLEAYHLEEIFY